MNSWTAQDAKRRFSALLRASEINGPQLITERGERKAVLVSINEWNSIQSTPRPNLKQFLLSAGRPRDFLVPLRGHLKLRKLRERAT